MEINFTAEKIIEMLLDELREGDSCLVSMPYELTYELGTLELRDQFTGGRTSTSTFGKNFPKIFFRNFITLIIFQEFSDL